MKYIDDFVNRITMYRLLLWGLRVLFAVAWIFSMTGVLPYGPIRPLVSISILVSMCYGANYILARIYQATTNNESSNITALLLFFIFQPPRNIHEGVGLALAGVVAIASKYVLTKHQRHIFNPAAFGAVLVGVTSVLHSRWWVGSSSMFIFVAILVILEVRKIHRQPMVWSFAAVAVLLAVLRNDAGLFESLKLTFLSFPIVFFGGLMLTEPITTPPRRYQRVAYGALVGLLFSSGLHLGSISMTPELSLVIGNLVVFALIARSRQPLKFKNREEVGRNVYQYEFSPVLPLHHKPGQYLELTLPLAKSDARGNRRSFTIASSPTEDSVILGIKHAEPSSAFKNALAELPKGTVVSANNLAGDFVLPIDKKTKMVFIAGGIGITPFRSMLKYLTDKRQSRSMTLFYAVSDPKEIAFKDVLNDAKEYGLKVVYVLTPKSGEDTPKSWNGEVGLIDADMIKKHVLDYGDRQYYISGPDAMVQANKKLLRSMSIARDQIKTDYFAGY
jgi:ferredoxin-NADP reductase